MRGGSYDKIVQVSTKLMSTHGFHGTSLQMISEKAGVTKSTIVHHFKSKEGILTAILDQGLPDVISNMNRILIGQGISPVQKLNRFIKYHLELIEKKWEIMDLFLMESKYLDKYSRQRFSNMQTEYWNILQNIIVQIQDNKKGFPKLDPKIVSIGIIGMLTWVGLWYRKGGVYNMNHIADIFWNIIKGNLLQRND